jgi:hypothetical protein
MMLQIAPVRWFSRDFTVSDGPQRIADIYISWWRERGELTVNGRTFRVSREGMFSGDFVLESTDGVVARASKPSALRRSFVVTHGTAVYTLQAASAFRRRFVLLADDREVGEIAPAGFWSRRATANLPEALPLPVRVFLIWLTVILWKREEEAAATAST